MAFRINTNVQSLSAQRNLAKIKRQQNSSLEKLASGTRIVRAGDDAAGLAISEGLRSNIGSSKQAARNVGDGIAMIQTAEGGMNEISNILIRLRELSIQSASDTLGDTERSYTDMEFQSLVTEINRIANSTRFNGRNLLDGSGEQVDLQVGIFNQELLDRITYNVQDTNATIEHLGVGGTNIASKQEAQGNLDKIDAALAKLSSNRASLGAVQSRLQSTLNNLEINIENLGAANSQIRDTDVAAETANLTKANILSAAGIAVLTQANTSPNAALGLIRG